MTPIEFRRWRQRHGLTQREAAATLDRGLRTIRRWESVADPLPIEQTVEMATVAYDFGWRRGRQARKVASVARALARWFDLGVPSPVSIGTSTGGLIATLLAPRKS